MSLAELQQFSSVIGDDVIVCAREIALRAFDLDHARACIGQPAGALRRGDGLLDRNDKETF